LLRFAKKHERLEGERLQRLLSPYWSGGYKQDVHEICSVEVDGRSAVGVCRMNEYFVSPTADDFHLSVFNAIAMLCQVGISHALFLNDIQEKNVEVLMSEFSLTLLRTITDPTKVVIKLDLMSCTVSPATARGRRHWSYYNWKYEINDGAWWGKMTLSFPFGEAQSG
jgi:hypothetical protein